MRGGALVLSTPQKDFLGEGDMLSAALLVTLSASLALAQSYSATYSLGGSLPNQTETGQSGTNRCSTTDSQTCEFSLRAG